MLLGFDGPLWAGIWAFLTVLAAQPVGGSCGGGRLRTLLKQRSRVLGVTGIGATVAALSAYLRNGGNVLDAFQEQAGRNFATCKVTYPRIREMLEARSLRQETENNVDAVAYALQVSCHLSALLGCEASRCIDAVGASYRRLSHLEHLKDKAFAMPKATMKLLVALPVLTLALGSMLGAKPLAFLLTPGAGFLCLSLGLSCYALGWWWMLALQREMNRKIED